MFCSLSRVFFWVCIDYQFTVFSFDSLFRPYYLMYSKGYMHPFLFTAQLLEKVRRFFFNLNVGYVLR